MIYRNRLRAVGVLLVVVVIGVWALGTMASAQELAEEQILRIGVRAQDIGPMDPHQTTLSQDTPLQNVIWDLLVRFETPGDVTTPVVPSLAMRWETSDDGLVWRFHLREGLQFHKGYGEMIAEDVKFSFDRACDPERSGKSLQPPWTFVVGTRVVDKYTVEVVLSDPLPDLLPYLGTPQSGVQVLCKKAVEERGDRIKTELIGTGPWMWDEYVPQGHITLVKNPGYWQGEPVLEKIILYYMPSDESRILAILTNELEMAEIPADQAIVAQIKDAGKVVDCLGPVCSSLVIFNLTHPPLDNWLVRAAIAHAINREEIAAAFGSEIASSQLPLVPSGWLYSAYVDIPVYDYNPELAKELLSAAGYPDGIELKSFTSTMDYYRVQFEVIQAQLKRIGVSLELVVVDHTTFHANQKADLNDLVIFGNCGWNAEQHLWAFWHSDAVISKPTGFLNYSHYGDLVGSVDDLLVSAVGQDPKVKGLLYAAAQKKLLLDLAAYPTVLLYEPAARQPYLDLGYEPMNRTTGSLANLTWESRILKH